MNAAERLAHAIETLNAAAAAEGEVPEEKIAQTKQRASEDLRAALRDLLAD